MTELLPIKADFPCQPYKTKIRTGEKKIGMTIQNLSRRKKQTWKDKTILATLHNELVTLPTTRTSPNEKHQNLKEYFLQARTRNAEQKRDYF